MLTLIFFLAVLGLLFWSAWIEPRWFHINTYCIQLKKKLPHPLRILHLSDIHFEAHDHGLDRFFKRLSQDEFDLIFITGDIIDHDAGVPHAVHSLSRLRAKLGIFAVLGNHDFYNYRLRDALNGNLPFGKRDPQLRNNVQMLIESLEAIGIHFLQNSSYELPSFGGAVRIHGLDDPTTGKADYAKVNPSLDQEAVHLVLAHSLDAIRHLNQEKIDMIFSGHSHGGQIRLPIIGPIITHTRMPRRYASGVHRLKETTCVVSRGVHAGRAFRLRFLCPPEAIVIELS